MTARANVYYEKLLYRKNNAMEPDRAALWEALADAESELRKAGSRLDLPGDLRIRLLDAAHRAEVLIEAYERQGSDLKVLESNSNRLRIL